MVLSAGMELLVAGLVLSAAALVLWADDLMPSTAGKGVLGADEVPLVAEVVLWAAGVLVFAGLGAISSN